MRIIGGDGGKGSADVIAQPGIIEPRLDRHQAKAVGMAHGMRDMAGGDQRFGRHAADIQAIAAHLAFFNQHDRHAHRRSSGGHRQAAGTSADDT